MDIELFLRLLIYNFVISIFAFILDYRQKEAPLYLGEALYMLLLCQIPIVNFFYVLKETLFKLRVK